MSNRLLWNPDRTAEDDDEDFAAQEAESEAWRAELAEAGWTPETYRVFLEQNPHLRNLK